MRAKVEHPFRVIKRQFGFVKVRYRGLKKEHAATVYLVRVVQFVDGALQVDGDEGMSAPKNRAIPVKAGENSLKWAGKCRNLAGFLGNPTI